MNLEIVREPTASLRTMWNAALHHVLQHRGGSALVATVAENVELDSLLAHLSASGYVWAAEAEGVLQGFVVVRRAVIEALYVSPPHRRQGVARQILTDLQEVGPAPVDALTLPGDRGTKSLYESFGWKARLLTMRAG